MESGKNGELSEKDKTLYLRDNLNHLAPIVQRIDEFIHWIASG